MEKPIDVPALYGALDSRRSAKELSWRQLARELGLSASVFTRLAQGRTPELDSYVTMTRWLGVSTEAFVAADRPSEAETVTTVEAIAGYLRADKALKPESAKAISTIVETAYREMADK